MPGWANYVAGISPKNGQARSLVKMSLQGRMLHIDVPIGAATVVIHDIKGHQVAKHSQGPGAKAYSLQAMAKGLYVVQVKGDRMDESRRILVP
jgi:hypothetical protein